MELSIPLLKFTPASLLNDGVELLFSSAFIVMRLGDRIEMAIKPNNGKEG